MQSTIWLLAFRRQLFARYIGYLPNTNMNDAPAIRKNKVKNNEFAITRLAALPKIMKAIGKTMLNAIALDGVMFR